jgi:hypothetical protein
MPILCGLLLVIITWVLWDALTKGRLIMWGLSYSYREEEPVAFWTYFVFLTFGWVVLLAALVHEISN